jgi:putative ABC transport system ATP-binding protein
MDSNLFKYILKHSWREQLFILALVLVSQVPYFLSLDLPKTIVNSPIQGKDSIPPMRRLGICHQFELPDFLSFLRRQSARLLFPDLRWDEVPYLVALGLTLFRARPHKWRLRLRSTR